MEWKYGFTNTTALSWLAMMNPRLGYHGNFPEDNLEADLEEDKFGEMLPFRLTVINRMNGRILHL